jgi:hypothetical protein
LGPTGRAFRRGFRPQHPHRGRARRLGPYPRSDPTSRRRTRSPRHRLRHRLNVSASPEALDNARRSPEYAEIGDRLPFVSGWPREAVEKLFAAHQLVNIASDPFPDLVAAEERRMEEKGLERRIRRRYAVWGDAPR